MFKVFKDELEGFKKMWHHGVLMFIATHIARIVLFPIMLLLRIYLWVYDYTVN